MKIDCHVHIGVDPLFYLQGWSPYCLDLPHFMLEAGEHAIGAWIVFPFVSYFALDQDALRQDKIELSQKGDTVPYRFENRRLLEDLRRLPDRDRQRFMPLLIADPSRKTKAQVEEWTTLYEQHRIFGIKIQPTIIQSPILSLLDKGNPILDFAEERDLPFLIHSSISPADPWAQCADILKVAEARPNIRFILAHSCRFHHESLNRVAELPNTWFDCSAHCIHCESAVRGMDIVAVPSERFPTDYSDPNRVLQDLSAAYPDKLIWGSDAPFYSYESSRVQLKSSYQREIDALNSLSPELCQKVSHDNTLAWLGGLSPAALSGG